jgi:hypothetical protein
MTFKEKYENENKEKNQIHLQENTSTSNTPSKKKIKLPPIKLYISHSPYKNDHALYYMHILKIFICFYILLLFDWFTCY